MTPLTRRSLLQLGLAIPLGTPALRNLGTPEPRNFGTPALRHFGTSEPENGAMVEWLTSLGDADVRPAFIPVSAEDRRLIAGTYRAGDATGDVWIVDEAREQLGLTRAGRNRLLLWCVEADASGWTFYPSGATAVRIKIHRVGSRADSLTVADPEVVLTARRAGTQPLPLALR